MTERTEVRTGAAAVLLLAAAIAPAAERWAAIIDPENSLRFVVARDGTPLLNLGVVAWGPNWSWIGYEAKGRASGEPLEVAVPFAIDKAKGEVIDLAFRAAKRGPREVSFRYGLSAGKDVALTQIIAGLGVEKGFARGKLVLTASDGKERTFDVPWGRAAGPIAAKGVLKLEGAGDIGIAFDPPCSVSFDGDLRIALARDTFPRGSQTVTLTFAFPEQVDFLASAKDLEQLTREIAGPDWFAFAPSGELGPSELGMERWLDAPAGRHGGVRMDKDRFLFEDETPVKFWGVNLSYGGGCAPEKKDGEFTAARFARYGINGVRLHKFSYPTDAMGIGDRNDATRMDPEGLDRLDAFAAELKKRGVYFGWSHTFGFHVCPGNRGRLLAYDEIDKNLKRNTYAFIHFAEDVQDLMIEMVVNLLGHRNPYTGLTYAAEPALSFIELQNEDDIFFYTSEKALGACPTYRARFLERFAEWLTARYGSEAALRTAWAGALRADESLAARTIVPQTNPWFFGDRHLPGQTGGARRRLLDTARFLHDVQNKFYDKFVAAIRAAGYKGPLVGSPWQAPSMVPHYYNLRSDYLVGYIDRHNYFGEKLADSMLARPGSGYFSTGLQQVLDRPFGLSEWIHVWPALYSAEGPAIIAAYGMGLQGWDASYEFQSGSSHRVFSERAGWFPWGVWEADVPTQLGQYPTLARMVLRGDVREAEVISVRRVSLEELQAGTFSFADEVQQQGDVKSFGGAVPPEALAAGRAVVEFTEKPEPSTFPDLAKHRRGSSIVAATGQLAWETAGKGFFTVDTPGTKAVVGFAEGRKLALGAVTFEGKCPYASIVLTAEEKDRTLADSARALLSAVARSCNTGLKYFALDGKVLDNGKGPILLEPVRAAITISGRKVREVEVLDHDGRRTGKKLPVEGGRFTIDGSRDRTMYYAVVFEADS